MCVAADIEREKSIKTYSKNWFIQLILFTVAAILIKISNP